MKDLFHGDGRVTSATVGELVRAAIGTLSPAERRVARVLLAAYPVAGLETVAELAGRAGVSGATVVRFVGKLGFDSYPRFQRALRDELSARVTSPLTLYETRPPGADVLAASAEVFSRGLADTFASLPRAEFNAAVDLLADVRRRVFCTGGRFSQVLAYYLHAHLHELRPGTAFIGTGPSPRVDTLVDIGRRDVVAVFDYRRHERGTVEYATKAADLGAAVVLFTDPWLSPIAAVADCVLPAVVEAPSPFDSIVGSLAVVETVVAALVAAFGDDARERIERLEAARVGFTLDTEEKVSGDGH